MLIQGSISTNSEEWNQDLIFTSEDGRYEGFVYDVPPYTAKAGVTAEEVAVIKRGDNYYYHSENESKE